MRLHLTVIFIVLYYPFFAEEALLAIDDAVDLVCNNIVRGLYLRQMLHLQNVHCTIRMHLHPPFVTMSKAFPSIAGTMNDRGNYGTQAYAVYGGTEQMLV